VMVAQPGNPLFKYLIQSIVFNVKRRYYGKGPFSVTGDGLLRKGMKKFELLQCQPDWESIKKEKDEETWIVDKKHFLLFETCEGYREDEMTRSHRELWRQKNIYHD
jgi:hypothetical protein